nr:hypothetical protein [uncultured Gellertiella sp.]
MERIIGASADTLVPHYLMACYAYYVEDDPLISDQLFDHITKRLINELPALTHPHKDLITMDDLIAGTGYALTYPSIVMGAVRDMRGGLQKGTLK